ncbi:glycosyltransferase [Eubacterium sp.]|uniref:glycosyltransferase family 2 protein n=1 Tax=Eubacterium sp. TaxID=142586 RepID=UPI0025E73589|nr:glycosyltransferase [Eubacterium sp.]MCR5628586.1 glycosyltransferase [Eubacterium sp.]
MRDQDLVSIIVPVYNVENYLSQCLNSLKRQMYNNIEIILVDDGSTDGSGVILDDFAKNESRAKIIHQENMGVSAARNKGLENATGKWVAFVDSDDWVERDYIDRLVDAAEIHDTKFAYCSLSLETGGRGQISILPLKTGKHKVEEVFDNIFFSYNGKGAGISQGLFDRQIIVDNMIKFDQNLKRYEEWIFYSLYIPQVEEVAVINHPLYHFNQAPASIKHKYRVYTESRAMDAEYLLGSFENNMELYGVDPKLYEKGLKLKYVEIIIKYAANIWDKRNEASTKDKHKAVKNLIENYKFHEKFKDFDFGEVNPRQKMEIRIAKSHSEMQLSTYIRGLSMLGKK